MDGLERKIWGSVVINVMISISKEKKSRRQITPLVEGNPPLKMALKAFIKTKE